MSIFFPIAVFYAVLVALALWGAWLGWTRSKSPTARYLVVSMALVWAGFTIADAWNSYESFGTTGVAEIISGNLDTPVSGSAGICSFCYEGPAGDVYVVAAGRARNGHYTFNRRVRYSLRFSSGAVRLNGKDLKPGCYIGTGAPGDILEIAEAQKLRLELGKNAGCH